MIRGPATRCYGAVFQPKPSFIEAKKMREYQTRELFRLVRFWLENYIKKASDRPTDAAGAKRAPCCTVEPTGSGRDRVKVCIKVSEL